MNLGQAVKTVREKRGISQGDCALRMAITQSYLSQIENNKKKPSLDILENASLVLGVPLQILIWISIDLEDIPENKRDLFKVLRPAFDKVLIDIFFED